MKRTLAAVHAAFWPSPPRAMPPRSPSQINLPAAGVDHAGSAPLLPDDTGAPTAPPTTEGLGLDLTEEQSKAPPAVALPTDKKPPTRRCSTRRRSPRTTG